MTGKELLLLRLRLGYTQVRMAEELDLFVNTVANYERGRRKIPRVVEIAVNCIANHNRKRSR